MMKLNLRNKKFLRVEGEIKEEYQKKKKWFETESLLLQAFIVVGEAVKKQCLPYIKKWTKKENRRNNNLSNIPSWNLDVVDYLLLINVLFQKCCWLDSSWIWESESKPRKEISVSINKHVYIYLNHICKHF